MNINVSKRRSFRLSSFVSLVAMYSFVYSLRLKLYISQRTENQRNARLNVGFVYSLHSFFLPL